MTPLMVTIQCITYNHEPYIRQALEGFVMQKTNFRFEAIVHDDASTDGTAAIIREYAERYPDIIKPIYETENQYSKGDGSLGRIMRAHTHGKYVALCEGDDYWTDPNKLQLQVDFLESHPDYSMCFHNAIVHYQDNSKPDHIYDKETQTKEYNIKDLILRWYVPTASIVYKKDLILNSDIQKKIGLIKNLQFGDLPLVLSCALNGRVYCINKNMSIYRIQESSVTRTIINSKPLIICQNFIDLRNVFPKTVHKEMNTIIARYARIGISLIHKHNYKLGVKVWWIAFKNAPIASFKASIFQIKTGIRITYDRLFK